MAETPEAKSASVPCPVRIFFDTAPLDQSWPRFSLKVENILKAAKELGVSIEIPNPVSLELEKHALNEIEKLQKDLRRLVELSGTAVSTDAIPSKEKILDGYRQCVSDLYAHWKIAT